MLVVGGVRTLTDMIQWFLIPAEIFISLVIHPTVWLEHRGMRMYIYTVGK